MSVRPAIFRSAALTTVVGVGASKPTVLMREPVMMMTSEFSAAVVSVASCANAGPETASAAPIASALTDAMRADERITGIVMTVPS